MSRFHKPNSQQFWGVNLRNDERVNPTNYRVPTEIDDSFAINLWPTRTGFSCDGNWYIGSNGSLYEAYWFEWPAFEHSGAASHYSIVGQTLDSSGVAMAAVTLEAFTTADDIKRGECVSNSGGEYTLPTQKTGNHYVRAYKAGGAYNYGGTSDNNLVPV